MRNIRTLLVVTFLFISFSSIAQSDFKYGVTAGGGMSFIFINSDSYSSTTDSKFSPSFHLGATGEY